MDAPSIIQTAINWWDLIPAIVGGILGALAGGIPAYYLSKQASSELSARDKIARESFERLALLRIYLALSRIGNDILGVRQQIDGMMVRPVAEDDQFPTQRRLSTLAGMHNFAENPFSDLELSPLASADGIELINQLDLLGRCYVTQINILNEFRVQKERLFDLYEQAEEANVNGSDTLIFTLDGEKFATKLKVRLSHAETVAIGVVETVQRNSQLIYRATIAYNNAATGFLASFKLPLIDQEYAAQKFPDLFGEV